MPLDPKFIGEIRQAREWTPDLAAKLAEQLTSMIQGTNNLEQQTNGNTQGPPQPPGKINGLQVTAKDGHFAIAIQDHNEVYRGVRYFFDHSDNANFTNAVTVDMGTTRNANLYLGNVDKFFRAYSAYGTSSPSDPVYHGDQGTPIPVSGGGAIPGPPAMASQGSGTGPAGVTLEGPGKTPFRSGDGKPPTR